MKSFYHKVDQLLLKKYPLIWNTKLVWMLLITGTIHLVFYLIGISIALQPTSFHGNDIFDSFIDNGLIFINIIISIILIVLWLVFYFKNNAFKNFYPKSPKLIMGQFLSIFVIILFSITFYYSYTLGLQSVAFVKYDSNQIEKIKNITSKGGIFIPHSIYDYELSEVCYPAPLDSIYRQNDNIDLSKPHFEFKGRKTQFYSYKKVIENRNNPVINCCEDGQKLIKSTYLDKDRTILFIKDSVVNVEQFIITDKPSLYNYGGTYLNNDAYNYYDRYLMDDELDNKKYSFNKPEEVAQAKWLHDLLKNDLTKKDEILDSFLDIAAQFEIPHNLSVKSINRTVNPERDYQIIELINSGSDAYSPELISYQNKTYYLDYKESLYKDLYFDSGSLLNTIDNIDDLRSTNIFKGTNVFFIWFSISIAILIFMFRMTSVKALLFSIVASGLVAILNSLLLFVLNLDGDFLFFLCTILFLTFWCFLGMFKPLKNSKLIGGVLINLGVILTIPILWFIVSLIENILKYYCDDPSTAGNCAWRLFTEIDITSFAVFIIALVIMYFWSLRVHSWKAMPDG